MQKLVISEFSFNHDNNKNKNKMNFVNIS